jgi:pimeloyl-ACP methyl ester carboxylesterase
MRETNMSTVTSKDGTTIAYEQTGSGPALILVNGAMQYRATDPFFGQLAELLAPHFTVINYDRRGRGDSGDTLPFTKERELEDLDALIRTAGGSAYVFAVSSGSALALDAVAGGAAITKLALFEPPFIVDEGRPPLPADYVAHLNELVAADRRGDAVAYFLTTAVSMPAEAVTPMRDQPFFAGLEAIAHTIAYDGSFVAEVMSGKPLPPDRWASVRVPLLVTASSGSPAWLQNGGQALVAMLPHAQRRALEGTFHDVAPDVLAPVLIEFFRA